MKISIVMATYNGEKYVKEQLNSLLNQTRLADEVLIFDDGSVDDTKQIVEEFIRFNNLEKNWCFEQNAENKGYVRNFLDGAEKASGDIVFYSDQDDVWDSRKLELMEKGFVEHSDMMACYCLRKYVDSDMREIPMRFEFMTNVKSKTDGFQKVSLRDAIKYNKSPGLCLAVKKELIRETRKMILDNGLSHDLPIGTVAAIYDGYYVLNRRLVNYRQHGKNVSAARIDIKGRLSQMDKQILGRKGRYDQMMAIYQKYKDMFSNKEKKEVEKAIEATKESIINLENRNLGKLFFSIFKYNPMINRWISVNNFLICLRNNSGV